MNKKPLNKQSGVAILLMLLVLFSIGSTVLLVKINNRDSRLQQETNIQEEMKLAKEALLAYAFSYSDNLNNLGGGPGRLPCPDSNPPSAATHLPDCSIALNSIARLPEREIFPSGQFEISSRYADIDRQFWYLASSTFRTDSSILNSTNTANGAPNLLSLNGGNDIAAIIIAPNSALNTLTLTQDRQSNQTLTSNYLESENADNDLSFSTHAPPLTDPDNFNDHAIAITNNEIMSLATTKVAQAIQIRLNEYYDNNGTYPQGGAFTTDQQSFDSTMTSGTVPAWFSNDQWDINTSYTLTPSNDVIISFNNCSINFTLKYNVSIIRDSLSC